MASQRKVDNMAYTMGKRFTATVRFTGEYHYNRPAFNPWQDDETVYVYRFADTEGNTLVWKTTTGSVAREWVEEDETGAQYRREFANVGALVTIKATPKAEEEYKGVPQIVINRVKVEAIVEQAETREEREERERADQLATLAAGDQVIWMPYRQYKEHYADCETIRGSYSRATGNIQVIVRAGRMKNSGTRGKHFAIWVFKDASGDEWSFYAVSKENALKQAQKANPATEWAYIKCW